MPSYAVDERRALCDLFDKLGPEAPTLCEGWTTADLAAHLAVRERRPDAAPGILISPLAGYAERVRRGVRDGTPWPRLVEEVRSGPPAWSPTRLGPINELVNTVEFYVHHEDVRRAQPDWEPRALDPALEDTLWARVRSGARLLMRRTPISLDLRRPDGSTAHVGNGPAEVTVTGPASELILLAFGRGDHARLDYEGPVERIAAVKTASFGL